MPALPPEAIDLAGAAHGRLSRRDLLAIPGVRRHTVDGWIRCGLLLRDWTGEYRVAGTPVTLRQQLLGATRRVGGHAANSATFGLHRAEGFPLAAPFTVAVPASSRVRNLEIDLVRIDLDPDDVERHEGVPTMTVERAAIGLAPSTRLARLRAGMHDLRRRGLLDFTVLRLLAQALDDAPGAPEMRQLIDSGRLISESEPEHDLGGIWRPGDPQPAAQIWVRHEGRYHRLDWIFLDSRLAPEYDGAEAHSALHRHDDAERTLALAARQIHRVPVTSRMLRRPELLREQLLSAHRQRVGSIPVLVPDEPPAWWRGP